MSFELGVLLGEYDGSQSFRDVGSWSNTWSPGSLDVTSGTTNTHSSDSAGVLFNGSTPTGALIYGYGNDNDAFARWSSEVDTHSFISHFWARTADSVNSGEYIGFFAGEFEPIAHSDSDVQHYRLDGNVSSGYVLGVSFYFTKLDATTISGATSELYMDDVLTAVDIINMLPSRDQENQESQGRIDSTTLGGRYVDYKWSDQTRFSVPVRYMPSSEAEMINRWWKNGYNLMFTDNSSDENRTYIVRIANTSQPFARVMRPYNDLFESTLIFDVIDYGLEF